MCNSYCKREFTQSQHTHKHRHNELTYIIIIMAAKPQPVTASCTTLTCHRPLSPQRALDRLLCHPEYEADCLEHRPHFPSCCTWRSQILVTYHNNTSTDKYLQQSSLFISLLLLLVPSLSLLLAYFLKLFRARVTHTEQRTFANCCYKFFSHAKCLFWNLTKNITEEKN